VCPGPIDTAWTHKETGAVDAKIEKSLIASVPFGRRGTPEEVANVYAFLASDAASFVTGALWTVDAGLTQSKAAVGEMAGREASTPPESTIDLQHSHDGTRNKEIVRNAGAAAATGLTALQGIDALGLRPRHIVLIFGASGAVGTMAVQFAAQRGAHVIATASGAVAARVVRQLGADRVIDARRPESVEQLRKFAPDGLDCVLALAGGDELERCLDFVRQKGKVVHPNGIEPAPAERPTFRVRSFDAVANPREFAKLNRHIRTHRIRVAIAARYPLRRAADAHRRLDQRVIGRMVLQARRGHD
jgi:NADPH-dependent curcumin reductase CurA